MKQIAAIFLFIIIIVGCKRYSEDNVALHLRGALHRVQGKWDLISYTIDGEDSLSELKNAYWPSSCQTLRYEFRKYKHNNQGEIIVCGDYKVGNWQFNDSEGIMYKNKNYASLYLHGERPWAPEAANLGDAWWIVKRLTNKELWLSLDNKYSRKVCTLKLKKSGKN